MKLNPAAMQSAAGAASDLLKSLSHPHRLMILCQLAEHECSVGQLAEFLNARDSTVSQHLALLRKDGMVIARRDGQTIWYAIASEAARELVRTLYRIYCRPDSACAPPKSKPAGQTRSKATKRT